jgi:cytochrome c oxidase subunit 2
MNGSTLRRWRRLALLLPLVLLAACAKDAPQDTLQPEGPLAQKIDTLQKPVFLIGIVVFLFVEALIVVAIAKFRARPDDDPDELPAQMHGNTRLEIGWTILPAIVLAVIAFVTLPVIFDLAEEPDEKLEVTVSAQKYWWGYEYPGEGNEAYGIESSGIRTANELHIPVGVPVWLTLESNDVIHSFWAPKLNGKRDVVPGRTHYWKLEADEPGVYSGQCGEFCGTSHAFMRLKVVAHDQRSWDEWVEEMQAPLGAPEDGSLAAEGHELFLQKGCAGCHQVDGEFEEVAEDAPSAPNLTKLFTRDCFAGCIYDLNDRNELEAWLRDPQRKAGSLMVIGALTEDEIDRLYAYLETLR